MRHQYKNRTAAIFAAILKLFSNINRNSPDFLYDLYLSSETVQQAIVAQEKIIQKIAKHGSCVIVGRAADYVLKDNENVFRVFVHAPKEYRIRKIIEMYGDSRPVGRAEFLLKLNAITKKQGSTLSFMAWPHLVSFPRHNPSIVQSILKKDGGGFIFHLRFPFCLVN